MREGDPNPHIERQAARDEARAKQPFHSGFLPNGRPAHVILPPQPHIPRPYDRADMAAWKALNLGTASPDQQRLCIAHLALLTNYNGDPYVPGDPVATGYGSGMRRVFQQISDIIRFVEPTRDAGGDAQPREQG